MKNMLPPLVEIHLYREALKEVERVSRLSKDKKLHDWALRALHDSQSVLMERARDEIDGGNEEENEQKKKDAEFFGFPELPM